MLRQIKRNTQYKLKNKRQIANEHRRGIKIAEEIKSIQAQKLLWLAPYVFRQHTTPESQNILLTLALLGGMVGAAARTLELESTLTSNASTDVIFNQTTSSGLAVSQQNILQETQQSVIQNVAILDTAERQNTFKVLKEKPARSEELSPLEYQASGQIIIGSKEWDDMISKELAKFKHIRAKQDNVIAYIEKANLLNTLAMSDQGISFTRYLFEEAKLSMDQIWHSSGMLIIHLATQFGSLKTVEYVASRISPETLTKKHGRTPLHIAAIHGQLPVTKLLVEIFHVDVNKPCQSQGLTALHYAVGKRDIDAARYLITVAKANVDSRSPDRGSPIFTAITNNDIAMLKFLVDEAHADLFAKNVNYQTPFNYAMFLNRNECSTFLSTRITSFMSKNTDGNIELNFAATMNELDDLKKLIEENANVFAIDRKGFTALHAGAQKNSFQSVKYLIENTSIDLFAKDKTGLTALDYAKKEEHIQVAELLEREMNIQKNVIQYVEPHQQLRNINEDLDMVIVARSVYFSIGQKNNLDKNNIFQQEAEYAKKNNMLADSVSSDKYLAYTKSLIDTLGMSANVYLDGVSFNDRDSGFTLFDKAAYHGATETFRYLKTKISKKLIKTYIPGSSPILYAAQGNQLDTLSAMIKEGLVNVNNTKTNTDAIEIAIANNNALIVEFILKHLKFDYKTALARACRHDRHHLLKMLFMVLNEYHDQISQYDFNNLKNKYPKSKKCLHVLQITSHQIIEKSKPIKIQEESSLSPIWIVAAASTFAAVTVTILMSCKKKSSGKAKHIAVIKNRTTSNLEPTEGQASLDRDAKSKTSKVSALKRLDEKNEFKSKADEKEGSTPTSKTLTEYENFEIKIKNTRFLSCEKEEIDKDGIKKVNVMLSVKDMDTRKINQILEALRQKICEPTKKHDRISLDEFLLDRSRQVIVFSEHYMKYIRCSILEHYCIEIQSNPKILEDLMDKLSEKYEHNTEESNSDCKSPSSPMDTSAKAKLKETVKEEPKIELKTERKVERKENPKAAVTQVVVTLPKDPNLKFAPAVPGYVQQTMMTMFSEQSKKNVQKVLRAAEMKKIDHAFVHQGYLKYFHLFLEGEFKSTTTNSDKATVDIIKNFAMSYHLTRFFVMMDGCIPDENESVEDMRDAAAHYMMDLALIPGEINKCVDDIADKKLSPTIVHHFPSIYKEKIDRYVSDFKKDEKILEIEKTQIYRKLHPIVEKKTSCDIPKKEAETRLNLMVTYLNNVFKRIKKDYDKNGAWIFNALSDIKFVEKHCARIDAAKFLLMAIGEIARHIIPKKILDLMARIRKLKIKVQEPETKDKNEKQAQLKRLLKIPGVQNFLFYEEFISFRNQVAHGEEIHIEYVVNLVNLASSRVHSKDEIAQTPFSIHASITRASVAMHPTSGASSAVPTDENEYELRLEP